MVTTPESLIPSAEKRVTDASYLLAQKPCTKIDSCALFLPCARRSIVQLYLSNLSPNNFGGR